MHRLWRLVLGTSAVYGAALLLFGLEMRQTPDRFSQFMAHVGPAPFLLFPFETMWKSARQGSLRPGVSAPDFSLPLLDHSAMVNLAFFRGTKPVVLVFGSYT